MLTLKNIMNKINGKIMIMIHGRSEARTGGYLFPYDSFLTTLLYSFKNSPVLHFYYKL